MQKILIVEDDADINNLIKRILLKEGYEAECAYSGTEAKLLLKMNKYDLILCDLMLPGISGEELISEIRKDKTVPVIVLTAKDNLDDKVNVLDIGADDYITKPFEMRELTARIRVQLRKADKEPKVSDNDEDTLKFKDIVLKLQTREVYVKNQKIELTSHEFSILKIMMQSPKKVFSKESLYEAVWNNGYYGEDNTISVHISNIRKKIAKITDEQYIGTVWGIGFKLNL